MTLKRINPEILLYHYFEFLDSKKRIMYALYDADMDKPVSYGSRSLVNGTIRNLSKNVTVVYYKPNSTDGQTFYNPRFQKYSGENEKTN